MNTEIPVWMSPLQRVLDEDPEGSAILVSVPVYRPDLAREMAFHLDLAFYDFRADFMSSRGKAAPGITLSEMTAEIGRQSEQGGVVFHNVEALLASYSEADRQTWLQTVAKTRWAHRVILPLYLFGEAQEGVRVLLDIQQIPEQTLISRMLNA